MKIYIVELHKVRKEQIEAENSQDLVERVKRHFPDCELYGFKLDEEKAKELENNVVITELELDLLRLLVQGKSNKQIASERGRREQTVKNHLTKLYLKLGVVNRTGAVLKAMKLGLIEIPREY